MSLEPSSFLRSEIMSLIQLYIPSELGHACISEVGKFGIIEFRDINTEVNKFQRAYTHIIKRLDNMELKLLFLLEQARELGLIPLGGDPLYLQGNRSTKEIDGLESKLNEYYEHLHQMNLTFEELTKKQAELIEHKHALHHAAIFFEDIEGKEQDQILPQLNDAVENEKQIPLLENQESISPLLFSDNATSNKIHQKNSLYDPGRYEDLEAGQSEAVRYGPKTGLSSVNLGFVVGVIPQSKTATLKNILWRVLRGNLFMETQDIEDLLIDITSPTLARIQMTVFIISAHGRLIIFKIQKLAESLGARLYTIDKELDGQGFRTATFRLMSNIEDVTSVLFNTQMAKTAELNRLKDWLNTWLLFVRREKLIHHTLNLCEYDPNKKCLIGEGWIARNDLSILKDVVRLVGQNSFSAIAPILTEIPSFLMTPPTYHRTNKFTQAYQDIVDAYGVGSYREINPALFSLVTFPFFFAVMFGDVGHGFFVFLFASFLCLKEKQLLSTKGGEIWQMLFSARYVVLLMGFFSIYVGLIYNDIFSRSFEIFPSAFSFYPNGTLESFQESYVYPFGVDPGWAGAINNLTFMNSYKMKQSILFGIIQMLFGILLSGLNMVYDGDRLGLMGIFLPQLIFMTSIFGYLGIMIVYKWVTQTNASPSLLTMLIQMILAPGDLDEVDRFYFGQESVQVLLVMIAFLCIPVMFLYKPIMVHRNRKLQIAVPSNSPNVITLYQGPKQIPATGLLGIRQPVITPSIPILRKTRLGRLKSVSIVGMGDAEIPFVDVSTTTSHPHEGTNGHGLHYDEEDYSFSDNLVQSGIHTVEFILGAVSNTASYLRLWALSLAHSQLSEVLWTMMVEFCGYSFIFAFIIFFFWLVVTTFILVLMEGLSAFLHALRLHWVEFNNKFYKGSGYKFKPFSYTDLYVDDGIIDSSRLPANSLSFSTSGMNLAIPPLYSSSISAQASTNSSMHNLNRKSSYYK